jgi:hypothetical protein
MIDTLKLWLAAADQVLTAKSIVVTILMAWVGGGAIAQWLKFPISRTVSDVWFDFTIRTVAVSSAMVFGLTGLGLTSSPALAWPLAVIAGATQPGVYHLSLLVIRHWWPWLEVHSFVGSVTPPARAFEAAIQREADKDGRDSGA